MPWLWSPWVSSPALPRPAEPSRWVGAPSGAGGLRTPSGQPQVGENLFGWSGHKKKPSRGVPIRVPEADVAVVHPDMAARFCSQSLRSPAESSTVSCTPGAGTGVYTFVSRTPVPGSSSVSNPTTGQAGLQSSTCKFYVCITPRVSAHGLETLCALHRPSTT